MVPVASAAPDRDANDASPFIWNGAPYEFAKAMMLSGIVNLLWTRFQTARAMYDEFNVAKEHTIPPKVSLSK